jgi:tetratricopeptide (TPR) repeat protein
MNVEQAQSAPSPEELNRLVALFQAGRHAELESQARALLARHPQAAFVWKALGLSLQAQGKDALPALQQAAQLAPDDAQAHFNLGTCLQAPGRFEQAAACYRRAVALKPDYVEAHNNLGNVLKALGQHEDAAESYRRAVELRPDNAMMHNNLGMALKELGELKAARESFNQALAIQPDYAEAHNNLGIVEQELGQTEEAVASYTRALELNPGYVEAHANLSLALTNLKQFEAAAASAQRALALKPDDATAHNNLGLALNGLGQTDDALACFRRALELKPDYAEAHNNLGMVLQGQGHLDEAAASYQKALELNPAYAEAHANLGLVFNAMGKLADAHAQLETAIACDPEFGEAHYGLAFNLLMQEKYTQGWKEYEWRWQSKTEKSYAENPCPPGGILPRPSDYLPVAFAGKRFLLLCDQGIGDELFFLRFVPEIRRRGGWVAYMASPKLSPVLARSKVLDEVIGTGECLPDIDYTFLVSEMPLVLGMTDHDPMPPPLPLEPLPEQTSLMRARLERLGNGPFLGITWWAGTRPLPGRWYRHPSFREIPFVELAQALSRWPGQILALQRKPEPGEIRKFAAELGRPVHDFSGANENLEEMLALLSLIDEYVGPSNTNMHLSASLSRPCRVLLTNVPDWRWLTGGVNSTCFPGFRRYWQERDGSWHDALAQLSHDLVDKEA